MTFLLDVSVLIALIDRTHVHHPSAVDWFDSLGQDLWATCPITENGLVRILGSRRYRNSPGNPAIVGKLLNELVALPGHVFWADDVSLRDSTKFDFSRLQTASQVTDSYLLALAQAHGGKLATLDQKLIVNAVIGGAECVEVIR